MTSTIHMPCGQVVLVDADDLVWLAEFAWSCCRDYARRVSNDRPRKNVLMHREIMQRAGFDIEKLTVDHIDGDRFNNQKHNLRVCTLANNQRNRKKPVTNTSGYKGVTFQCGRWAARIRHDGGRTFLGYFDTAAEAGKAYDEAARELHGEFYRPLHRQ